MVQGTNNNDILRAILKSLCSKKNSERAKKLSGYFKTGRGEYGEGDVFWGITVPVQRKIAKEYKNLRISGVKKLLASKIHEQRLTALLVLLEKFKKASEIEKKEIFDLYIKNTRNINNWDLVDLSAPRIVGAHLFLKDKKILYKLARSENVWERRIAVLSTLYFVKHGNYEETLTISELLLEDRHDLIRKAVGWMLREVGKKNLQKEKSFLNAHIGKISRTTLRYAVEKFKEEERRKYLTA